MQIPCVYLPGPAPAVSVANNKSFQPDGALLHAAISFAETLLHTGKLRFCHHLRHPKLAGLQHWRHIASKKASLCLSGLSETNHLADAVHQS